MKGRKAFSPEFKCEAAGLVVDRGYSIAQACETMGVGTPSDGTKRDNDSLPGFTLSLG